MLTGHNPEEVLRTLKSSLASQNSAQSKLGLVIEGGSLRGIYSCGVLHALADAGLQNSFDVICGSSSGALYAVYFPNGEMEMAASIYIENAIDKRCLNIWNFPNVLNVKWLVNEWILGAKKFDVDSVLKSRAEILVPTTDILSGENIWFSSRSSAIADFERSLVATSLTPVACNEVEQIGSHKLSDGLVQSAIPIMKAIELGCTHIVVALTRPFGYRKTESSIIWKLYESWRIKNFGKKYKENFHKRHISYNYSLDLSFGGLDTVNTLVVCPANSDSLIGNTQGDREKLIKSFWAGHSDGRSALNGLLL